MILRKRIEPEKGTGGVGDGPLRLTQVRVPVAGLPAAFDGLRVLLLTDLHGRDYGTRLTELAQQQRPDLIVLGGDMVDSAAEIPTLVRQARALAEVARRLLDAWEPEQLLISLAAQGMALFGRDGTVEVIPTRAREVFDVSGAGDTVTVDYADGEIQFTGSSAPAAPEEPAQ